MSPSHFFLSPAHVPTLYFMVNLWVQHCGPPWALHPLCHERGLVPGAWQGLSAGSRPQSAVAQGHLCWLPSPSARGGSIPLPGSASRGDKRAGSSTAPSLHPSILVDAAASRRGEEKGMERVPPGICCPGA